MRYQACISIVLWLVPFIANGAPRCVDELVYPRIESEAATFAVRKVVSGLEFPWSIEFIDGQRILITERPGRLCLKDGDAITEVRGVPEVRAGGQGGLLDVIAHPDFSSNQVIYVSYAAAYRGGSGTRVMRARLQDDALTDRRVIFEMDPPGRGAIHFGSRFAFDAKGDLFFTF
jgi:aldose sugar dehydrogenase